MENEPKDEYEIAEEQLGGGEVRARYEDALKKARACRSSIL